MTFKTTRFTVTFAEYQLLRPGLEILANGLANAKEDRFPHRHTFDRIDQKLSDIYKQQRYSEVMAETVILARSQLHDMTSSRKVRMDVFELSTVALALRVAESHGEVAWSQDQKDRRKILEKKLKMHWKRVRRALDKEVGPDNASGYLRMWNNFVQWLRYNVLQRTIPKWGVAFRNKRWSEQREALASMVKQAITEGEYRPVAEEEVARIVGLAKADLRRGRLTMTLSEVLQADRAGRDLLLEFAKKRIELIPLSGPVPNWCIAAAERGEKFKAARVRRPPSVTVPGVDTSLN